MFTGGGVGALSNYDALSAIPAYLTPSPTPFSATQNAAPQAKVESAPISTTPTTGSNPIKSFEAALPNPKDFTPPNPKDFTPLGTRGAHPACTAEGRSDG